MSVAMQATVASPASLSLADRVDTINWATPEAR